MVVGASAAAKEAVVGAEFGDVGEGPGGAAGGLGGELGVGQWLFVLLSL